MNYSNNVGLNVSIDEFQFFSQTFDSNTKKIFLLGSSNIRALNTTHIQNYLLNNDEEYEIFNLAEGGNSPTERLETLDLLISTNPDIVVYGLAPRDFFGSRSYSTNTEVNFLPNTQEFFDEIVWKMGFSNFNSLGNPKLTTLSVSFKIINNTFYKSSSEKHSNEFSPFPNAPFFMITSEEARTKSTQELKNDVERTDFRVIDPYYRNTQFLALKEIIARLQENNVKVILFTVPHHQILRDTTPESIKNDFNEIMDHLSQEFDLDVYQLYDQYSELDIWGDPIHIVIDTKSLVFSEKISKIILKEIHKNAI